MSPLIERLAAGRRQRVLVYGTSLTRLGSWVRDLRRALDSRFQGLVTMINAAESATDSAWGVAHLRGRVLDKGPDAVLIEFASNDALLARRMPVAQSLANHARIVGGIRDRFPACEVVLQVMNPPVDAHLRDRPRYEFYHEAVRRLAAEARVRLVDHEPVWRGILRASRVLFDAYVPDGMHPNQLGCRRVVTPSLLAALWGGVDAPLGGEEWGGSG